MPEAVLVDGYNVLHAIPRFAPRGGNVAEGRRALEGWLAEAGALHRVPEIVLVWDGGEATRARTRSGRLRVLYTEAGRTADERILDLCRGTYANRAGTTWVVSSDRDVQGPARQLGFTAIGAMTFYRRWSPEGPAPAETRTRRSGRVSGAEANPRPARAEVEGLLDELLARREKPEGGES